MKTRDRVYERVETPFSVSRARSLFLQAVSRCTPEAIEQLQGEPYSCWLRLSGEVSRGIDYSRLMEDPQAEPLRESLITWARNNNLDERWCLERALDAFPYWGTPPEDRHDEWEGRSWTAGPFSVETSTAPDERHFRFEYDCDDPIFRSPADIREQVREAFERELEAFIAQLERAATERGFVAAQRKSTLEHYEWLAFFQVRGLHYEEIRQKYPMISSPQAIQKATKELAAFIGLKLREDRRRPGRPAKSAPRR